MKVIGKDLLDREVLVKCDCHSHILSISIDIETGGAYFVNFIDDNGEKIICNELVLNKDTLMELGNTMIEFAKKLN